MRKVAPLFILISGILWGCIGLFVRPLNEAGLHSMEIVAIRAFVTLISMFIFLLVFDRSLLKIHLKDIWCFFGTGICSIVFFNFCYFSCISLTSLSVAAVLLYTAPVMVMVLSFLLFKEPLSIFKIVALIMTIPGCVLVTGVFGNSQTVSYNGILVGLGAGLGYALYSIFGRFAIERGYGSLTITFYTFLFASVACCFIVDYRAILTVTTSDFKMALLCGSFGIICTVLPYLLYTLGLNYTDNGKASIIASIEPVTASLLGVLVFHEKISACGILGIAFVILGVIICNIKHE